MLGIVIAMESEAERILDDIISLKYSGDLLTHIPMVFGTGGNKPFAVIISGIGKVNAAAATQSLITNLPVPDRIDKVINIGVCGATPEISKNHTVFIDAAVEFDFDLSAIDRDSSANVVWTNKKHRKDCVYTLYTADHFTTSQPVLYGKALEGYFDMEGYAVARVCELNNIPVTIIKSVTDVIQAEGQTEQYDVNFNKACKRLKNVLNKILREELRP